jgi:putative ATP-dependent endonuclease of the OLD family
LGSVKGIPLRKPTILTGHNDGGKSATLAALAFLLGKYELTTEDRTFRDGAVDLQRDLSGPDHAESMDSSEAADLARRASDTVVTGHFKLSDVEQQTLQLPSRIQLRKRATGTGRAAHELLQLVSEDPELRGISAMKLPELKMLASRRDVVPSGSAVKLDSWRNPLLELAASGPQIEDWALAPRAAAERLPIFLSFSSTDEPDPEAQVRKVLQAAYERMLTDPELIGPVLKLEEQISIRLQTEAEQLCKHIQQHVPELTSVSAVPSLSFRHGLGAVNLRAYKGTEDVGLKHAGAGRQRRISLAVWEWTSNLIATPIDDVSVVIAYDEPDTHLDYRRQRDLMDLIHAQCANPLVSMIVATHSINLIDRVDVSDVVQVSLDDAGRTVTERLTDETYDGVDRYLASVSAALGLRTSVLLHERCLLAVEGPTEQQTFPILFRLATGRHLQSAGIALIACGNNDAALRVTRFLIEHNRLVIFLLDKDSVTNEATKKMFNPSKLRSYLVKDHQVHYVGGPNELEELYSDSQWAETANELWPRTDSRGWNCEDIASLRGSGKFSDRLKDLLRESSEEAPSSKQDMNLGLVLRLKTSLEVPETLRQEFVEIARIAEGG